MIIFVYLIISSPILAMIFFIFYKSFLALRDISRKNSRKIFTNPESPQLLTQSLNHSSPNKDESTELTAVISAALSYYYSQK